MPDSVPMHFAWLALQILTPVVFWAAYHYYKDRHLPEPPGNLLLCLLAGAGAAGVGKLLYAGLGYLGLRYDALELGLSNLPALFAYAVLAIGPIEEIAKALPFVLIVPRFKAFDEPVDGIVYASFIALGFAAIENVHYVDFLTSAEFIARGFAAPLVHILFASVWGFYLGRSFLRTGSLLGPALWSIALAAFLHGVYDFSVLAAPLSALPLSAGLILFIWVWRMLLIRGMHSRDGFEDTCRVCESLAGDAIAAGGADGRGNRPER